MLKRDAKDIYTVRIYQLEISVPVSEFLFSYSAYKVDKSKRIPVFYLSTWLMCSPSADFWHLFPIILHMQPMHTNKQT